MTQTSMDKVNAFRDARNWRQFHNEKDLALSISLEAAELLEIFQWGDASEALTHLDEVKDELADVIIYSYMLASNLSLEIDRLIDRKLVKTQLKYPVTTDESIHQACEWPDDMSSLEKVVHFRTIRGWDESTNAMSMAISIVLEAAELLELFQWKTAEEGLKNMEAVQDELADILIYCLALADHLNLNTDELIDRKLIKNNEKYPINQNKGRKDKYTDLR